MQRQQQQQQLSLSGRIGGEEHSNEEANQLEETDFGAKAQSDNRANRDNSFDGDGIAAAATTASAAASAALTASDSAATDSGGGYVIPGENSSRRVEHQGASHSGWKQYEIDAFHSWTKKSLSHELRSE